MVRQNARLSQRSTGGALSLSITVYIDDAALFLARPRQDVCAEVCVIKRAAYERLLITAALSFQTADILIIQASRIA